MDIYIKNIIMKKVVRLTETDLTNLVNKIINEGKNKYEFIDEHPSYRELNSKISELKKIMKTISKDLLGGIDYVEEYIEEKLLKK
jgi:hypothetical protein